MERWIYSERNSEHRPHHITLDESIDADKTSLEQSEIAISSDDNYVDAQESVEIKNDSIEGEIDSAVSDDSEAPKEEHFQKISVDDVQSQTEHKGLTEEEQGGESAQLKEEHEYNQDEVFMENGNYNDEYNEGYYTAYNEGYTEGYKAGYDEAHAMAFKSYQEQLAQMKSYNKYQLTYDTLPKNAKKYWKQRYGLFRKFDQGVYMTSELWYSVTPEALASFVAKFIQACNPELRSVVDIYCGGGGNTIQFARRFEKVIGIDINDDNLFCTRKNCELYGVGDKIELKHADWTKMEGTAYYEYLINNIDLVFSSPPWGGPAYKGKDDFDLNLLEPMPIKELLISFFKISPNVVLFLPRNSNLNQLADVTREILGSEAKCRVIYTYCDGFIKGIIALWGEKFMPESYNGQIFNGEQNVSPEFEQGVYRSREEREQENTKGTGPSVDIEMDY